MEDAERRLRALEAARDIEAVKARYSSCCDDGYDPDGIAELFAPEGTWQATGFGRHCGREEIRRFMSGVSADIPWAWHSIANPAIELSYDGTRATARWYSLVVCERRDQAGDVRPMMLVGKYRDELVLIDGAWRFESIDCTIERSLVIAAEMSG